MKTESLFKILFALTIFGFFTLQSCKKDDNDPTPEPTCVTTNVSYATVIVPILEAKCYACHKGDNPQGGFTFDTYETLISNTVDNERLYGTIKRQTGFAAMPPTAAMDECQVSQIKAWIDQGALDN